MGLHRPDDRVEASGVAVTLLWVVSVAIVVVGLWVAVAVVLGAAIAKGWDE